MCLGRIVLPAETAGEKGMGFKFTLFIIALVGLAYMFYINPQILSDIASKLDINTGRGVVWTNANFTSIAPDPNEHRGERVELNMLAFNTMKINAGARTVGVEGYLGSADELTAKPYDTSRRVLVGVKDVKSVHPGSCMHVSGHIRGVADVETLEGKHINVVYIEADNINEIPCSVLEST